MNARRVRGDGCDGRVVPRQRVERLRPVVHLPHLDRRVLTARQHVTPVRVPLGCRDVALVGNEFCQRLGDDRALHGIVPPRGRSRLLLFSLDDLIEKDIPNGGFLRFPDVAGMIARSGAYNALGRVVARRVYRSGMTRVVPQGGDLLLIGRVDGPDLGCPICGRGDEHVLRVWEMAPVHIPDEVSTERESTKRGTCELFSSK